jgi:hypothetical protein
MYRDDKDDRRICTPALLYVAITTGAASSASGGAGAGGVLVGGEGIGASIVSIEGPPWRSRTQQPQQQRAGHANDGLVEE